MAILDIKDVFFSAGGKDILHSINIKLKPNNLTVILGPTGAGKSILLRLMHGLLVPTKGSILWNGQSSLMQDVRIKQSFLFQHQVFLRTSVLNNIMVVLNSRGIADKDIVMSILEKVGLGEHAKRNVKSLSGGERQKLGIARALSINPEVVFLDEPTSSLDPDSVFAIEELINIARNKIKKVIVVTHDMGQAQRLADDIVFIKNGCLVKYYSSKTSFPFLKDSFSLP